MERVLHQSLDQVSERLRQLDRLTRKWWFGETVVILMCLGMVGMALLLTPSTDVVSLFGYDIPILCGFRRTTGIGCPGCGMTRSFSLMAHGYFVAAFNVNWLGPPMFLLVASQVPYRAWTLYRRAQKRIRR